MHLVFERLCVFMQRVQVCCVVLEIIAHPSACRYTVDSEDMKWLTF